MFILFSTQSYNNDSVNSAQTLLMYNDDQWDDVYPEPGKVSPIEFADLHISLSLIYIDSKSCPLTTGHVRSDCLWANLYRRWCNWDGAPLLFLSFSPPSPFLALILLFILNESRIGWSGGKMTAWELLIMSVSFHSHNALQARIGSSDLTSACYEWLWQLFSNGARVI